jgi:hypothetical protein
MPSLDGTGPRGKGPLTGYGRGNCVISITSSEQELDFLTNQAQILQAQLKQIRARLKRLERKDMVSK